MKTQIFKAPEISCSQCEQTIKGALTSVPGVEEVPSTFPAGKSD